MRILVIVFCFRNRGKESNELNIQIDTLCIPCKNIQAEIVDKTVTDRSQATVLQVYDQVVPHVITVPAQFATISLTGRTPTGANEHFSAQFRIGSIADGHVPRKRHIATRIHDIYPRIAISVQRH